MNWIERLGDGRLKENLLKERGMKKLKVIVEQIANAKEKLESTECRDGKMKRK